MRYESVRSSSFDGTVDASAFAAGAAAFARRWEENAEKNENASPSRSTDRVTARWVAEPDPLVRRAVAPGYLALEGALVECVSDVFEEDTADTSEAEDSEGALFEDAAEEDDLADLADLASAATRGADVPASSGKEETKTTRKTTLLVSYHAVYSPSYRAPVLVARARLAAPPRATLAHAQLDRALARADPGGLGSARASFERPPRSASAFSAAPRSVFAPWEHPHADAGGCWLGAHPCETPGVMRLLLGDGGDEGLGAFEASDEFVTNPETNDRFAVAYFAAWFAFASRAAPGLGSIARR